VQVGGGGDQPPGAPPTWEADAYGPDPLIIHVGDTVKWSFAGGHTVTFNSGQKELPLILPGKNPGELMIGPAFFPQGIPDPSKPVSYDGTQQINSGIMGDQPNQSISLTFTKTGLFGYVCMLHPGMRGNVEVREASAPLTETPAQAKARGLVTLQTLAGKVKADAQQIRPINNGPLHTALAGIGDAFGASALGFFPGNIQVKRGDWVTWTQADPFEIHTVTFTSGAAVPDFVTPQPQAAGPPTLVIAASIAGPSGDTYTGTGIFNSGILTYGNMAAFKIDAPPGSYDYFCVVHPWMKGTVTVTG
jgi:plastocyanin